VNAQVLSRKVNRVISHYKKYHGRAQPGEKERRLIRARLKEGYSAKDLCEAIDGCHRSPHHCGENERRIKYQTLALIVRDSSHVQQFLEVPPDGPADTSGRAY
jgi:hypothetical protein